MPECNGEATLEEDQEFICPHCGKKFTKKVTITGEVTLEVDLTDYAPDYSWRD